MSSSQTYHNGRVIILRGDARNLPLPDDSVDLIVTSPPFWKLRSYTDAGEHYEGQIGDERTPEEYIAALVDCTREWARVLKPSGSMFVELGDKYDSGTTTGRVNPGTVKDGQGQGWYQGTPRISLGRPKCLLDLPARYSIACVDQLGLIKRANIVWHHVNGLPESVTDRVRVEHSMVFHFTVRPRYFSAVDEIREPHAEVSIKRAMPHRSPPGRRPAEIYDGQPEQTLALAQMNHPLGRLPGSVWAIPSAPLVVPEWVGVDHFAAFPPGLVRRIVAGWSPSGICTACGEGRRPVAHAESRPTRPGVTSCRDVLSPHFIAAGSGGNINLRYRPETTRTITGYACGCPQDVSLSGRDVTADGSTVTTYREPAEDRAGRGHLPPTRPAVVLDPFGGTGTTALVASAYGRVGVSVDRSGDYCRLAAWRTRDPGERARALGVPKPPPVPDGQGSLFDDAEAS